MNKADLINRIATGSRISKAQAATAIDTAVGQHYRGSEEGRSGGVDWFRHLLGFAEKSPQWTQSADGRHH